MPRPVARIARWFPRVFRARKALPRAIRTVEVEPPSRSGEMEWVCNAAVFVVLVVIYVIAFQTYGGPQRDAAASMLPYQVLFRDLPGTDQRVFRAMQEGTTEALRTRANTGAWPSVDDLATAGVPPFAPDVLDRLHLAWTGRRDGPVVEYVGVPGVDAAQPGFLVLIQEPPPVGGEQPTPGVVDEEHQLLPGNKLLHVTYWTRTPAPSSADMVIDPALAGWKQIRIESPFKDMEKG